jgi:Putative Ig domain
VIALVSQGAIAASGSPAFGQATAAGNLLVAWVGSNGGTGSFTTTTSTSGWALAADGGAAFGWSSVWYKANSAGSDAAPVFTDSAGAVQFSQLAEFSGAALSSPVDQSGGAVTAGGLPAWEVILSPDTTAGDLVCAAGFWNGANSGATVQVIQFTDSAGAAITPNLAQASSGGVYLASLWGVTSNTGSAGDIAWMNVSIYNGGNGAVASFKPASPASPSLAIAPQVLPVTWLNFPYVTRILTATGGAPSYSFTVSAGSLPPGMSLSAGGALTGSNVTSAGTFSFTVQVTDGNSNTATAAQSITVNPPPAAFPTLTTASGSGASLPPGGAYSDKPVCPASNGFNTYVSANWVQPVTLTQTIGAYSPSVFYVSANAAPSGTGQVQAGPGYFQLWGTWGTGGWNGSNYTPLNVLSALSGTFDATDPLTGSYELEFDIWTGYTSTNVPGTGNAQDIMIWMDTTPERSISTGVTNVWHRNVTVGGRTYDVYGDPFGGEIIFALQGPGGTGTFARMTSGTIDILSVLNWCVSQGLNLGNPPYINSIYFGWEICNTDTYLGSGATATENFITNNFTYNWQLAPGAGPVMAPVITNRVVTVPVRAG